MKRLSLAATIVALVVLQMPAVRVSAQQEPPAGRRGAGRALPPAPAAPAPAEVQAWFDAMVIVQAQRVLGLSDAQYPQFVGRLKALQDTRRRNQHARAQIIQQMAKLTGPRTEAVDEAQLREKMKALDDLQAKAAAEVRKAYEGLDQVLDVRQQARFRVFEDQIERRKFEILLNARRRQGTS